MSDHRQAAHGEPSASDPVAAIEAALDAFRGGNGPGRGFGGPGGPSGRFGGRPAHGGRRADPREGAHDGGPDGGAPHGFGAHGRGRASGFAPFGGSGGPAGFGLGPVGGRAAFRLLAVLSAGGPKSVSELADLIGVDQPRASRLVRAAIDAGQVRREADPHDARRSILVLTDAGRGLLASAHDHRRSAIDAALADFSEAERADFARLFSRFVAGWTKAR